MRSIQLRLQPSALDSSVVVRVVGARNVRHEDVVSWRLKTRCCFVRYVAVFVVVHVVVVTLVVESRAVVFVDDVEVAKDREPELGWTLSRKSIGMAADLVDGAAMNL